MKRVKTVWIKKNPWFMKEGVMRSLHILWFMPVRRRIDKKGVILEKWNGNMIKLS